MNPDVDELLKIPWIKGATTMLTTPQLSHVYLFAQRECIDRRAWRRVYDESVLLLERCGLQLLRRRQACMEQREIQVLDTDIFCEFDGHPAWAIVGDATSKRHMAEFLLPSHFGREPRDTAVRDTAVRDAAVRDTAVRDAAVRDASVDDAEVPPIAIEVARERLDPWPCLSQPFGHVVPLFDGETERTPYHTVVLAVGLLCERRFPGRALLWGDLTPKDGEKARRLLEQTFDEPFGLPLVTERSALSEVLARAFSEDVLARALWHMGRPELPAIINDLVGLSLEMPKSQLLQDFLALPSQANLSTLSPPSRDALDRCIQGLERLLTELEWPTHRRFQSLDTRSQCIQRIAESGLVLTTTAWQTNNALPLSELRLLAVVASLKSDHCLVNQFHLALFENPVLQARVFRGLLPGSC